VAEILVLLVNLLAAGHQVISASLH
jgi:hypothetical protein